MVNMRVICTRSDVIDTITLRRVVDMKQLAVEQAHDVGAKQLIDWLQACLAEREDDREQFETLLTQGDYEISIYQTKLLMQALGVGHPEEYESAIRGYRWVNELLPEGLVIKVRCSSPRTVWEPTIYLVATESL